MEPKLRSILNFIFQLSGIISSTIMTVVFSIGGYCSGCSAPQCIVTKVWLLIGISLTCVWIILACILCCTRQHIPENEQPLVHSV